ncbi:TonB-dependent receptor [soil metagenome]
MARSRPPSSPEFRAASAARAARTPSRPVLSLAVQGGLWAMACSAGSAVAQVPQRPAGATTADAVAAQPEVRRPYRIAAGTLGDALAGFAAEAGISITMPPALVQGKTTRGLQGSYAVREGFAQLLAGSGLEAAGGTGGAYALRPAATQGTGTPGNEAAGNTLAAVTVTADAERSATTEGTRAYTSRAVTIGKTEQALKDIPQSVSVLTRQRMDDQNITSLPDAINSTTGMVAVQGVGPGVAITARGFAIDSWQYDGVPVPRNMYSLGNWAVDSLVFYDRVEILRGAAGLLQGAGSPGGAINFVRKRGQAENTVTLTGKAGSWDHYGAQLDAGGPLNAEGTLHGRVVIDEDRSHSYIDSIRDRSRTLYAALDYDVSADTTVGIGVSNKHTRSRPTFIGLPRNADGSDIGLPRSTYTGATWNRALNDQTAVYADATHRIDDRWTLKAATFAMNEANTSVHQRVVGSPAADGSGLRYGDFATDQNGQHRGVDVSLSGRFDALGLSHELVLGANYAKYTTDDNIARAWTTGGSIFDIDHDRPWQDHASITARNYNTHSTYDVGQKGVYGSLRTKLAEPLTAIVGGRVGWYDQVYAQPDDDYADAQHESGKFIPYAGLVYALSKQWSAYTSYAQVFEPQSGRTVAGSTLKPVTGTNLEAGLKGELMGGRLNTALAVFRYDHRNRSVNDLASGYACDGWYCVTNAGKVRSQGFEAEASGELLPGLQLFAGYTFNTTKYLEDAVNEGKVFSTWTPKHMLRLWSDYQLRGELSRFSVGGGVTVQSHAISYDRAFNLPGFSLWGLRLGYRLNREVSFAVNVENLFDKRYYVPSYNDVDANNYYGKPRSVLFTVKYTPKL